MKKFSSLTIAAAISASISAPALAQTVGPATPYDPPLYSYAPAPPLFFWSPYSNHPAATGGGSWGYNVDTLRNQ
jgi:hypothetical protein